MARLCMHYFSLPSVSCSYQVVLRKFLFLFYFYFDYKHSNIAFFGRLPFTFMSSNISSMSYRNNHCVIYRQSRMWTLVLHVCICPFFQSHYHTMHSRSSLGNKTHPFLTSILSFIYFYLLSQFIVCLPFLFRGIIIGICNCNRLQFEASTNLVHKKIKLM